MYMFREPSLGTRMVYELYTGLSSLPLSPTKQMGFRSSWQTVKGARTQRGDPATEGHVDSQTVPLFWSLCARQPGIFQDEVLLLLAFILKSVAEKR